MLMIHYLMECDKHVQSAAKEYRRVYAKTQDNWQPNREKATGFKRETVVKYVELLEENNREMFIRFYKNHYIIMKVIGSGVVHYYTEEN